MLTEAQTAVSKKMLDPASAANTAAATSSYIDCSNCEGDIVLTVALGALTGSFTPTLCRWSSGWAASR